ncbi:hypothetical protein CC80DRAFT_541020 [Byssothecium circinans]|uniref:Uncharacterized protein n=1 Tax=Byssothecium circinans TaxID=147558 RepID=A0A6A5T8C1_9PLEO|nr:hypothetical protein CC80DRAFT_541020 [Byssothecium circinans]
MTEHTDEYYVRLHQDIKSERAGLDDTSEECIAIMKNHLPTEKDVWLYFSWLVKQNKPQPKQPIPSAEDYIVTIKSTNFKKNGDIAHLTQLLDLPAAPYIALGTSKRIPYRLLPNAHELVADKDPNFNKPGGSALLPDTFLGVNFNDAGPASEDKDESSGKDSVMPSPDRDEDGFVFYQLGQLECWPCYWGPLTEDDKLKRWKDTGFAVGVKVSRSGIPGNIYIFFNFNPMDDTEGSRYKLEDVDGGSLTGHRGCIALARIAEDITHLGHGTELMFADVHQAKPNFVMVSRRADGQIVRQTELTGF